jgi:hypothetical protein
MMFAIASYAQLFHLFDVHPGSYFENMYALMCLGISQDSIPANEDGSVKTENQLQWLSVEEKRSG